jgi:hypothetical protein
MGSAARDPSKPLPVCLPVLTQTESTNRSMRSVGAGGRWEEEARSAVPDGVTSGR